MILASVRLALGDILSPPFRAALWKSLGLTFLVLVGLWFAAEAGATRLVLPALRDHLPALPGWHLPALPGWLQGAESLAGWAAGLVLAVLLAFLLGPVGAIIAGLFLDDVADAVAARHYPESPPGRALPFLTGLLTALRFFGVALLGNAVALLLLLVPGVNLAAFFVVNGYLLGREYFEFAALRHVPAADAAALRRRHRGRVFLAGLAVAALLAVPVVNILTPLFAAALMVHLHHRIRLREGGGVFLSPPPAPPGRLADRTT